MSEWQPARYVPVHSEGAQRPDVIERTKPMLFRIREWAGPRFISGDGRPDCGASLYEIHPDDAEKMYGHAMTRTVVICAHEILTD